MSKHNVPVVESATDEHTGLGSPTPQTVVPTGRKRRRAVIILSILLVIMIGVSVLLFIKYKREADHNPATRQQALTEQLGQVVEMPSEEPVISTVLDRSKLTNQALAHRAHNGDQLFIFPRSKRLILYRPSTHKVVDMLNIQT